MLLQQFVGADAQDHVLDDIQLVDGPIKKRLDLLIESRLILADLPDQGGKQLGINIAEILFLAKLGEYFTHIKTGQMPLVQGLQCTPAGAAA